MCRLTDPPGKLGHAETEIGSARFMLAEEYPDFGALSPATVGGTPVSIHLYVPDVDATVARSRSGTVGMISGLDQYSSSVCGGRCNGMVDGTVSGDAANGQVSSYGTGEEFDTSEQDALACGSGYVACDGVCIDEQTDNNLVDRGIRIRHLHAATRSLR